MNQVTNHDHGASLCYNVGYKGYKFIELHCIFAHNILLIIVPSYDFLLILSIAHDNRVVSNYIEKNQDKNCNNCTEAVL